MLPYALRPHSWLCIAQDVDSIGDSETYSLWRIRPVVIYQCARTHKTSFFGFVRLGTYLESSTLVALLRNEPGAEVG